MTLIAVKTAVPIFLGGAALNLHLKHDSRDGLTLEWNQKTGDVSVRHKDRPGLVAIIPKTAVVNWLFREEEEAPEQK